MIYRNLFLGVASGLFALGVLTSDGVASSLDARTPSSAAKTGGGGKVILDTDIGDDIDDVYALSLALSSPELEVLGITSAWGNTALRSRLLDRLLCETGRESIPVRSGVSTTARHTANAAAFSQAPWATAGLEHPHTDGEAVPFLLDQIKRSPGEITLIALGPLTNLAAAIDRDPATFRKLRRVVLMGGSVARGYDTPEGKIDPAPSVEYNMAMDPAAARKLFTSGVPIVMLPLDSTQLNLEAAERTRFATISSPLTDALEVLTLEWSHATGRTSPTLFDPVAVAYAIDAATCPATPVHIEVDEKGLTQRTPGAANAEACLTPHPELFFPLLMTRLVDQHMAGTKSCVAPPAKP